MFNPRIFISIGGEQSKRSNPRPEMPKVRFPREEELDEVVRFVPPTTSKPVTDHEEKTGKRRRKLMVIG